MIISLVFDGHVRSVTGFGLNLFITFSVACFTEFPADSLLTVILDRWGRRWLACLSLALSGIFCLFATVAPQGVYVAVLAICGRFFANISYNIGLQYAAELLPTVVRAQGVAFIHIMGYVASIVAPFVIYLGKFQSELPLLVLGVLGVAGGFLALYLPETLGKELPQTLTDGEEFGRDQKMWDFPCMSKYEILVHIICEFILIMILNLFLDKRMMKTRRMILKRLASLSEPYSHKEQLAHHYVLRHEQNLVQ